MKVLVTGANGMLGTHTILQLLDKGYEVRGLVRNPSSFQLETTTSLEVVQGDILNSQAVEKAMNGCDYVVHTAAITAPNLLRYEEYRALNVGATVNLLEAAVKQHVRKFIYVGSANAVGHGDETQLGNEDRPVSAPFTYSLYAKSKLEAQQKVLSYSNKMEVVVANPTFMIGGYDARAGSGRIILMGYNKPFVFYPPGGKNFVNTRDAAKGVVATLEKGKNGRIYLLAGENLSYREFFEKLNQRSPRQSKLIELPKTVLLTAGYLAAVPRKLQIRTNFSLENLETLVIKNYYDNSRAKKELGVEFHPIEKGIDEAVSWFVKEKMI